MARPRELLAPELAHALLERLDLLEVAGGVERLAPLARKLLDLPFEQRHFVLELGVLGPELLRVARVGLLELRFERRHLLGFLLEGGLHLGEALAPLVAFEL